MSAMDNSWALLKNVETARVTYGSHMPEVKPHPAALSYANKQGYEGPDGRFTPSGTKPTPQRSIEIMPREPIINRQPNMQNMGINPTTGQQMTDEAYDMDYDSQGRRYNAENAKMIQAAKNTVAGRTGRRAAGGHYPGIEGTKHSKKVLGPIGSDNPRLNALQVQGDLDHLDRLPLNVEHQSALQNSRMSRRHVNRPSSSRMKSGKVVHDKEGRRNKNVPVRDFDKPQEEQNLISTGYAMRQSWGTLLKQSMCKGKDCKGCRGCKSCPKCKPKGSTCEKMGC